MNNGTPVIYKGEVGKIVRNRNNGMYDIEMDVEDVIVDNEIPPSLGKQTGKTFVCVYENEFTVLDQRTRFDESVARIRRLCEARRLAALKTLRQLRVIATQRNWSDEIRNLDESIKQLGGNNGNNN